MKKKNYPVRKTKNVHTKIGVGIWKQIEKIAKQRDVSKLSVVNELLASGLAK